MKKLCVLNTNNIDDIRWSLKKDLQIQNPISAPYFDAFVTDKYGLVKVERINYRF